MQWLAAPLNYVDSTIDRLTTPRPVPARDEADQDTSTNSGTGRRLVLDDDARAALRKRFRQKLAVGAWRDLHTHLLARLPYVNPTPVAEAKLLVQRAEFDRLWMEKRMAVQQRRLGEGEALAARAGSGRGTPANCANVQFGTTAANQATEFLTAAMSDITRAAQGGAMGARASAAAVGQAKDDSRSASQISEQRNDGQDGGGEAAALR